LPKFKTLANFLPTFTNKITPIGEVVLSCFIYRTPPERLR